MGIEAEKEEFFTYTVCDNQDLDKIRVLAVVSSENGIDYVSIDDNNTIYGYGKNKLAIDIKAKKDIEQIIKIKENGKEEIEKRLVINDAAIEESTISINSTYEIEGYRSIDITKILNLADYEMQYQIGKTGKWKQISNEQKSIDISVLDYDVTNEGLINEEDNTITISAKLENQNNNSIVMFSKKFTINPNSSLQGIPANSILDAVEKTATSTGLYKISVNGQNYNLKVHSYNEDLDINTNTSVGSIDDVATADSDAKNMVVLRVNGNLNIKNGVTLTAYSSEDGYGGPKGFFIYCTGTITNNGTINMTARGAKAEGQDVYLWKNTNGTYEYVPAIGAIGGESVGDVGWHNGNKGDYGKKRQTGGGGSGSTMTLNSTYWGQYAHGWSGNGGSGTSYSGGTGGGYASADPNWAIRFTGDLGKAGDGDSNGGLGGFGIVHYPDELVDNTGAGNPKGGTGGLLIIYSNNIKNNGKILSNGVSGEIYLEETRETSCGGGSSGGGSINIFIKEEDNDFGSIEAKGGLSAGDVASGAGGMGSVNIGRIVNNNYVCLYDNNPVRGKDESTCNRTLSGSRDINDMTYKNPVIPQGFVAIDTEEGIWEYNEESEEPEVVGWNEGLVISDGTNEFVWVPVDGTDVTYEKWCEEKYSYSLCSDMIDKSTTLSDGKTYKAIPVTDETEQITKYGGFYVARFEAGSEILDLSSNSTTPNNDYSIPVSKKGVKVWNNIDYDHVYVNAAMMINDSSKYGDVKSGLITGTQWDTIMRWYTNAGIGIGSTDGYEQNWGSYSNIEYTVQNGIYFTKTGTVISEWKQINKTARHKADYTYSYFTGTGLNLDSYQKNIADIAGNFYEYTSEFYTTTNEYIARGGCAVTKANTIPASYRIKIQEQNSANCNYSFRSVLYIQ